MSQDDQYDVIPAHLDFLSIYSPDLAEDAQLVFHYSRPTPSQRRRGSKPTHDADASKGQDEARHRNNEHRRMRQIGLAQGMVNFARFAGTKDVDSVETEKNRIVIAELERGWWILASIRLTRINMPIPAGATLPAPSISTEYSSREVSPPIVLVQQLRRAHRVFNLHHSHSLSDLFVKLSRTRFCTTLDNYWLKFAASWDVLLHNNAVVDAFDGLRLAGGGELGIGVGEEEFGSAERDYLEELVRSTDGLNDLLVYRSAGNRGATRNDVDLPEHISWELAEGTIFAGVHYLGPDSIQSVSEWSAQMGSLGPDAYAVTENPMSSRKKGGRPRPKKQVSWKSNQSVQKGEEAMNKVVTDNQSQNLAEPRRPSIPPSLISPAAPQKPRTHPPDAEKKSVTAASKSDTGGWMNYLTLGYGTQWGSSKEEQEVQGSHQTDNPSNPGIREQSLEPRFLIGWKGPLSGATEQIHIQAEDENDDPGDRLSVRVVHVEVYEKAENARVTDWNLESTAQEEAIARHAAEGKPILVKKRLRTIVYQHDPFTFVFMFEPDAASLAMSAFYQELHQKLVPLQKALVVSTSPQRVHARLKAALPSQDSAESVITPVYDFIYDPLHKIVRSTLPNIPSFREDQPSGGTVGAKSWSRLEALNVYTHILALISEQGANSGVGEQSVKTIRNWWITWLRLPVKTDLESVQIAGTETAINESRLLFRDAILVRRATERGIASRRSRNGPSSLGRLSLSSGTAGLNRLMGRETSSSSDNSEVKQSDRSGLVEDAAIDPRRYVEALLSINR